MMEEDERTQSLDAEIAKIQKSTRTSVPAMLPLHDVLRQKYPWYYKWHLNPYASMVHWGILLISLAFTIGLSWGMIGGVKEPVAAAGTCNSVVGTPTWNTAGNWDCGHVPTNADDVHIIAGSVVTVDTAAVASTFTIDAPTTANGIYISTGQSVTVTNGASYAINNQAAAQTITMSGTGNFSAATFTIPAPTSTGTSNVTCEDEFATGTFTSTGALSITGNSTTTGAVTMAMGSCTLSAGSIAVVGGTNATGKATISASTGTITSNSTIAFTGTAGNGVISTSGAAKVNVSGNVTGGSAASFSFNAASTFVMNATGSLPAFTYTFGNFKIAGGMTTLAAAETVAGTGASAWLNNSGGAGLSGSFVVSFTGSAPGVGGSSATTFYGMTIGATTAVTLYSAITVGAGNLVFTADTGASRAQLTQNGYNLTVTGSTTFNQPGANYTSTWAIGTATATLGALTMGGTDVNARIAKITLTSGTLNLTSITFAGTTPANKVIDASGGAATIKINGPITTASGATSTPGTSSTWIFQASIAQTIPMGTAGGTYWGACTTQCYANLTILNTNTNGATLGNTAALGNISGNVTVGNDSAAAKFSNGGYAIGGAGNMWFTVHGNATFNMTGTSTYPAGFGGTGGFTYDPTSTVNYKQTTAGLTVTAPATGYGNLGMMAAALVTQNFPAADLTVAGNLTIGDGTANVTTAVANASYIIYVGGNWLTQANSLFTHSNGTVTFNGTAPGKTINNRASSFYNVIVNGSGVWSPLTNTMTVANDLTMTAGTLNSAAGTASVTVNGNVAGSAGIIDFGTSTNTFTQNVASNKNFGTDVAGSTAWTFYNLTFTKSAGTPTITTSTTGSGDITVKATMTVAASTTLDAGNRTWHVQGTADWMGLGSGTFTPNTSTVSFEKTTNMNIWYQTTFYNLQTSPASGTPTYTFYNNTSFLAGTKVLTTLGEKNIEDLKIGGLVKSYDLLTNKVVTSPVTSTEKGKTDKYYIINNKVKTTAGHKFVMADKSLKNAQELRTGDKLMTYSGIETVQDIEIINESVDIYDIEVEKYHLFYADNYLVHNVYDITVNNNFTMANGGGSVTVNGASMNVSLGVTGNLSIAANQTFVPYDVTITGNYSNAGTLTPGSYNITFDKGTDIQTLDSGGTGAGKPFNNIIHSGAGTLQLSTNALNVDGSFTNSAGTFDTNSLAQSYAGNFSNSATFTAGTTTATFDKGSAAQTLDSGGTGAGKLFNNLIHSGAGTLQLTGNAIDIDGNFENSVGAGTFNANGLNINVAKNWTISGGSFSAGATPGTQTVTFDSTNTAIVSGSTTFNNLTMDASVDGAKQINFTAGTTQTISSGKTWTLNGNSGEVLTLQSSVLGSAWYFNISAGFTSGGYISVCDSWSANANKITPGSNVTECGSGNNDGWLFVPTAPTIGAPEAISATAIRWKFTDNAYNETGFKVYEGDNLLVTCATPATYCDEIGLSVNYQYTGRYVVAYNGAGNSAHSGTAVSIYTLADTPLVPGVTANSWENETDGNSLTVTVNPNTNPDYTTFAIYCNSDLTNWVQDSDGTCGTDTIAWKTKAQWDATTNIFKNLPADTDYTIRTKAKNGDGEITSALENGSQKTAPAQVTGEGHASNTTSSITWSWTANTTPPDGYKVYEYTGGACSATVKATSAGTSVEEGTLSANTSYDRCLRAYRGAATGKPSTNFSAYTYANIPAAPTVTAVSTTALKVIINVNANPSATEFAISNETLGKFVQADGSSGDTAVWQDYTTWGDVGGIDNSGLTAATTYTYKNKARNGDSPAVETGLSDGTAQTTLPGGGGHTPTPSPSVSPSGSPAVTPSGEATTPSGVTSPTAGKDTQAPTAPTNLRATQIGALTLTLAWDASTDNTGVKGYQIYNAETGILVGTTASLSFDFNKLTPNTTYKFYLRAFDGMPNYSANSEILTISTLASQTEEEKRIELQGGVVAFLVLSGLPQDIPAGAPLPNKIKITSADAGGKIVKGYSKSIYFSSSDKLARITPNESHPYTFTSADAGIHEFPGQDFVFNSPGRQEITVSDYSIKSTAQLNVSSGTAAMIRKSIIQVKGILTNPQSVSQINIVLAILIAGVLIMPALANFLAGLGSFFPFLIYGFHRFFQMLGLSRKRKTWGVVFNSETGQPIPFAMVKLLDKHNHLIETAISDRQGRYGFILKHGTFHLQVARADFHYPSKIKTSSFYERVYLGSEIKVADLKTQIVFNIPLDPYAKSTFSLQLWFWLIRLNHPLQKIRLPLLILGFIFALVMLVISFQLIYLFFLLFCILVSILVLGESRKAKAAGLVTDVYLRPTPGAIVRIYHREDNRLMDSDVSDRQGHFEFKVAPGIYYLFATKPNYVDFKSHLLYLEKTKKKEAVSAITIKLRKE